MFNSLLWKQISDMPEAQNPIHGIRGASTNYSDWHATHLLRWFTDWTHGTVDSAQWSQEIWQRCEFTFLGAENRTSNLPIQKRLPRKISLWKAKRAAKRARRQSKLKTEGKIRLICPKHMQEIQLRLKISSRCMLSFTNILAEVHVLQQSVTCTIWTSDSPLRVDDLRGLRHEDGMYCNYQIYSNWLVMLLALHALIYSMDWRTCFQMIDHQQHKSSALGGVSDQFLLTYLLFISINLCVQFWAVSVSESMHMSIANHAATLARLPLLKMPTLDSWAFIVAGSIDDLGF